MVIHLSHASGEIRVSGNSLRGVPPRPGVELRRCDTTTWRGVVPGGGFKANCSRMVFESRGSLEVGVLEGICGLCV